jgi:hypothetical protein
VPVRDRNWIVPFGKYKGSPLHEVMANDPQYLQWLQSKGACDFDDIIWSEMREMFDAECDRYSRRDIESAVGSLSDFIGD